MQDKKIPKVMLICTANACRSQMAEGFAKHLGKGLIEPYSAGLFSFHVHPLAIKVMKEIGIDISKQESKAIEKDTLKKMDIIITLCTNAEKSCPVTPSRIRRIHWPIHDPVGTRGTEEEIMTAFRAARDKIKERIEGFISEIKQSS